MNPPARRRFSRRWHAARAGGGDRRRSRGAAGLYRDARAKDGFEGGVEMGLRAILASTEFLFRIERDPQHRAEHDVTA